MEKMFPGLLHATSQRQFLQASHEGPMLRGISAYTLHCITVIYMYTNIYIYIYIYLYIPFLFNMHYISPYRILCSLGKRQWIRTPPLICECVCTQEVSFEVALWMGSLLKPEKLQDA